MHPLLHDLIEALKDVGTALAPAALGSAVAQAYQRGLSLRDRLVQWAVGIVVSWYATQGLREVLHFGDFMAQSVGFVVAMIAFQAAPKFIAAASDIAGSLPAGLRDRILDYLPRKPPSQGDEQ